MKKLLLSEFGCIKTRLPNTSIYNFAIRGFYTTSFYPPLFKSHLKSKNTNPSPIHAQAVKLGLYPEDTFVLNSLVSAYANVGHLDSSLKVFDEITQRDVVSWTAVTNAYIKKNLPKQALDCFLRMRSTGLQGDKVTVVSLLRAAGMLGDVWFGKSIHALYVEPGRVCCDVYIGGALIDMYAKCGLCDDAMRVSDQMPLRSTMSWSALITAYLHSSRFKEALVLFQDMLVDQIEPNQTTLSTVLTACANSGALDQGRWVHSYINQNNIHMNTILGTSLIDMYSKCGCIHEALSVFQKLGKKNVYAWTTMINGLAVHGHGSDALSLFSNMLRDGVRPNEVTFIAVLSACCHGGLVDEGRAYFGSMTQVYGLKPRVDHYGCFIDLLGRAGRLDESLTVIKSMPMKPSAGVWGALLHACIIHKNYELGTEVGERLIELQPNHSGRYMVLANLYSACGKKEDAARVRKLMKAKGVVKSPALSLVEVYGAVHEFASEEKLHSQSEDTYNMLEGVSLQLKLVESEPEADL